MDKNFFNLTKFALEVTEILLNLDKIILFINEATTLLLLRSLAKYPQVSVTHKLHEKKQNGSASSYENLSKHLDKMGINDRTLKKNVFII